MINWAEWWEDHPKKYKEYVTWANLRPETYSYEETFKHLDKTLQFKKTDSVLDLGCGTGELSEFIVPKVEFYAGVDFSMSMIKLASQRHGKYFFTRNPIHNLDFIDQRFDKIFAMGVWQYVSYDFAHDSIVEMLRVLKKDGTILLADVFEKSDPAAGIYDYPKEFWNQFPIKTKFIKSSYEPELRYDVLITKK